jgi:hypothetical protein
MGKCCESSLSLTIARGTSIHTSADLLTTTNYAGLLAEMGLSEAEILVRLRSAIESN